MTKQSQKKFVSDLCRSVEKSVRDKIIAGQVPPEWNGMQLREYLVLMFERQRYALTRSEKRRFNNDINITTL